MTKIKICGVTQPAHALAAAEAGASFIGLVFAESSRRLTIDRARPIVEAVRRLGPRAPKLVGVFANAAPGEINRTAEALDLDYVQLSGDEPEDDLALVRRPAIKAVHVPAHQPPEVSVPGARATLARLRERGALPLLDTKLGGRYGGSGATFDWTTAQALAREFDLLLAGGLTPANVGEAVGLVHPWGVDVSSGVERDGAKDPALIRAFVRAVRDAEGPA